jgi:pimeloyl-ACP methyl ester carboxylesterase
MPSVRVGDVDVAYGVEGEGLPLLLVHGTAQSRVGWVQLAPLLAPTFECIMPDLPGSGETLDPGGPLEVADLARLVLAVADDLGHDRIHLLGYSLGAVVAAEAAAQAGPRVRSLTLLCGWATTDARMRFTFDLWQRLLATDRELFARYVLADAFTASFFELLGSDEKEVVALTAVGFAPGSDRHLELDQRVDIAQRLGAISAPTLVVGGLEDRWVDIRHSRELAERIPTARLVELPCGHAGPVTELAGEVSTMVAAHAAGR